MSSPRHRYEPSPELIELERHCAAAEYALAQSFTARSHDHILRSAETLVRITRAFEDCARLEGHEFTRASDATQVVPDPSRVEALQERWRNWSQDRKALDAATRVLRRLQDSRPRRMLAVAKGVLARTPEHHQAQAKAAARALGGPGAAVSGGSSRDSLKKLEVRLFESERRLAAAVQLAQRHARARSALIDLQAAVIRYESDFDALAAERVRRGKSPLTRSNSQPRGYLRALFEGGEVLARWVARGERLSSTGRMRARTQDPHHRSVVAAASAMQCVHDGLQRTLRVREARLEMQLGLQERQYAALAHRLIALEREGVAAPELARAELQERFLLQRMARSLKQLDFYGPACRAQLGQVERELEGRAPGAWHREAAVAWAALPSSERARALSGAGRNVRIGRRFYAGIFERAGEVRALDHVRGH